MTRRSDDSTLDRVLARLRPGPNTVEPDEFRVLVSYFFAHEHDRARRLRATRSDRFTVCAGDGFGFVQGEPMTIVCERELNASNGITVTQYARQRGIARSTLSRWVERAGFRCFELGRRKFYSREDLASFGDS